MFYFISNNKKINFHSIQKKKDILVEFKHLFHASRKQAGLIQLYAYEEVD